jgi:phosphoenolpyruvate-protein phosphotransferase
VREIRGIAAAPGIAAGPISKYITGAVEVAERYVSDLEGEWRRLTTALEAAAEQLKSLREKALASTGADSAAIFDAQAAMLADPELLDACRKQLERRHVNVEIAWRDAVEGFAVALEALESDYLRARAADVRDVGERVLRVLTRAQQGAPTLRQPSIIVAEALTPSDTVMLDKALVLGFCTAGGGATSHTAILARSLGLPAVVGAGAGLMSVSDGGTAILNGNDGFLLVDPEPEVLSHWEAQRLARTELTAEAHVLCKEPAVTRDGKRVEVVANIGSMDDASTAVANGAEGVGLLRTEFLYLERQALPDETEQARAYESILDVFGSQPVVLRTLDIGGDKAIPYLGLPAEANSFLGVRGLRLCLRRPDLFKPQLRAALRTSIGHNLKIMFPMVAAVEELKAARRVLGDCMEELRAEGKPFAEKIEVGIMVEVPSAAIMADRFAPYSDFFSIGTNDLTQYTLAADRTNPELSSLSSAFSPPVLHLIASVIHAAHDAGKWVGVCGELAGEPLALPILLGLGLDEFSMNSPAIPMAKQILRRLDAGSCRDLAQRTLVLEDAQQVRDLVSGELPWITG